MINPMARLTPDVMDKVAEAIGMPNLWNARGKRRDIAVARWRVFYLLSRDGALSYAEIGRAARMDHTSVLSGIKRVTKRLTEDAAEKEALAEYERAIGLVFAKPVRKQKNAEDFDIQTVHRYTAMGYSPSQIAKAMGVSPKLVEREIEIVQMAQALLAKVIKAIKARGLN